MNGLTRHQAAVILGTTDQTITNLYNSGMIMKMREREKTILCDFIGGMSFWVIAEKYNLSYARIQQIVNKAAERLEDTADTSERMRTNWELQQENDALRKEIAMLKEKYESEKVDGILPDDDMRHITNLLQTKLVDLNFKARILNCLVNTGGMETIDDLLKTPKTEILRLRSLGKKSFYDIIDEIEGHLSLVWRLDGETDADYYARLNKIWKGVDEWE